MAKWVYQAQNYRAAIGEIRGGTTPLAVFDVKTGEPLQYVSEVSRAGKQICDEWDVRLEQWSHRFD